jgi:hypothetical protein
MRASIGNGRGVARRWPPLGRAESCGRFSMRSCFSRLCRAQRSWTFRRGEVPPRDQWMMWSKCRLSVLPHFTHWPPSRLQTSNLTGVGMRRVFSGSADTVVADSSDSSSSRNLKTRRPSIRPASSSISKAPISRASRSPPPSGTKLEATLGQVATTWHLNEESRETHNSCLRECSGMTPGRASSQFSGMSEPNCHT